jgi:hypothetical protein
MSFIEDIASWVCAFGVGGFVYFFVRDNCVMGVCVLVWVVLLGDNWLHGCAFLFLFFWDDS